MAGGTRELGNPADMPRVSSVDGTEVLPALRVDGTPIAIPTSVLGSAASVIAVNARVDDVQQDLDALDTETAQGFQSVANQIAALELEADSVTKGTWADLLAVSGTREGQRGVVTGPDATNYDGGGAGTHEDPVTETTVDNTGWFSWVPGGSGGWQWISTLPEAVVASVAGKTGDVVLVPEDVGLGDIDTVRDLIGSDNADDGDLDLSDSDGGFLDVTGEGDIESLGDAPAGLRREIRLTDFRTFFASENLLLPGNYNIKGAPGDVYAFRSLGGGVWQYLAGPTGVVSVSADEPVIGRQIDQFGFYLEQSIEFEDDGREIHAAGFDVIPNAEDAPGRHIDQYGIYIDTDSEDDESETLGGFTPEYILAANAEARAYAEVVRSRPLPNIAGMTFDKMIGLTMGQSLAVGGASHPLKTTSIPPWNVSVKMVGSSVRGTRENNTWYPFGSVGAPSTGGTFAFQDAVATMDIDNPTSGNLYNPDTWVGPPTGGVNGESTTVAGCYELLKLVNEARNEPSGNFASRELVATIQGFGGQTIESLISDDDMPGTGFSAWLRWESYCTQFVSYMGSAFPGETYGVIFIEWNQGQANGRSLVYKGEMSNMWARQVEVICGDDSILQQEVPPALFICQTSEHWTEGSPEDPQAQHVFALENDFAFIYAPTFAVPGKMTIPVSGLPLDTDLNEHKDGNAKRWLGSYLAKLVLKVVWRRENYEHPHILRGERRGREVLLTYHAPVGPLQARNCFIGYRQRMLPTWGINVYQNDTLVPMVGQPELVGSNAIRCILAFEPTAGVPAFVGIGDQDGRHNIFDSDPAVSRYVYEHSHQDYAAENPDPELMTAQEEEIEAEVISELGVFFDKPYPLPNAAVIEMFELTEV